MPGRILDATLRSATSLPEIHALLSEGRLQRRSGEKLSIHWTLDPARMCASRSEAVGGHVRSNHVHAVVEAEARPERIMNDFNAYASRHLSRMGLVRRLDVFGQAYARLKRIEGEDNGAPHARAPNSCKPGVVDL